jgi:hypothetical protein
MVGPLRGRHCVLPGGVTDGHRQGVGGVFGFGRLGQPQQRAHHHLHLVLLGPAVAHHAGFHLERPNTRPPAARLRPRSAAPRRALAPAARRFLEFLAQNTSSMAAASGAWSAMTRRNPAAISRSRRLKGSRGSVRITPGGHHAVAPPVALNDPVAGAFGPAINAQNAHEGRRPARLAPAPPSPFRQCRSWRRRSARRRALPMLRST